MQNRSNLPQNKTLTQSPVKSTNDRSPMQNSTHLADGKTPNQPTENKEN